MAQLGFIGLGIMGYRMTAQRRLIIRVALHPRNAYTNCKDIYQQVSREDPAVGIATVYRTLRMLMDERIVERLHDAAWPAPAVSVRCPECGATRPAADDETLAKCVELVRARGYDAAGCRLQILVPCGKCKGGKNHDAG